MRQRPLQSELEQVFVTSGTRLNVAGRFMMALDNYISDKYVARVKEKGFPLSFAEGTSVAQQSEIRHQMRQVRCPDLENAEKVAPFLEKIHQGLTQESFYSCLVGLGAFTGPRARQAMLGSMIAHQEPALAERFMRFYPDSTGFLATKAAPHWVKMAHDVRPSLVADVLSHFGRYNQERVKIGQDPLEVTLDLTAFDPKLQQQLQRLSHKKAPKF